jgi:NTP pyrophosphatase (non-canonical NTP hydrolase)
MDELKEIILKFRDERNWKQFHTPENLAKSIAIEAGELLECFQWDSNNFDVNEVKDELADVFIYCIHMADALNVDLKQVVKEKMIKNAEKYPVKKSFNNSTKYNKL